MAKFCVYCGAKLPDDMLFCTSCGRKLEEEDPPKMCPRCGRTTEADERFCIKCGFPLLGETVPVPAAQEDPPRPIHELRAKAPAREKAPDQEEVPAQAPRGPVREAPSVLTENTIRADREIPAENTIRADREIPAENTIRADREIPAEETVGADQDKPNEPQVPVVVTGKLPAENRPPAIHTKLPYQSGGAERPEETSPEERRAHILQILSRKSEAEMEMESSMSDTGFFSAGNL